MILLPIILGISILINIVLFIIVSDDSRYNLGKVVDKSTRSNVEVYEYILHISYYTTTGNKVTKDVNVSEACFNDFQIGDSFGII